MSLQRGKSLKHAVQWLFCSLERRLCGALLLIVICAGAMQFISEERSHALRTESEALRISSANAEHASELLRSVSDFRMAAHIYMLPGDAPHSGEELTDAAIRMGEQVTALRLSGVALYDYPQDIALIDGIDRHISAIRRAAANGAYDKARFDALEARTEKIQALAAAIEARLDAEREHAYAQLTSAAHSWHMLVSVAGFTMVALALLILFDFLFNILPAMRRMHRTLRRLSDGDLDFEIETFRLRELQNLSVPLETFRRNALAVKNLAFTDPSTGMANRRAFMERAGARLDDGPLEGEEALAILVADVDNFKHVNDDYGHAAGDQLMRLVGERMIDQLGPGAIVARTGGDEFAICIPVRKGHPAFTAATGLVSAMRAPFDMGGFTVSITISLGLVETQGCGDGGDAHALLNRADLALYASKNGGRNRASLYTSELETEREEDRGLERDLARAFDRGQLRMVYQPIHPTQHREDEVEALVRWAHPELGEISPGRFIPAAERSNQMVRLGGWIIERSLADLARWPDLTMSINLSPLQLQQDGFVDLMLRCCRKHGILPRRVILEVTETLSIERNTRALMTLNLLRNSGFRIALDDFGTGYSSLCLMKTFKFDRLKLDRSLIEDIGGDPTSRAVFDAAVTMALKIGAEVVAEGIGTAELVEPVRSAGCTHMQGFHYSRPIEADEVAAYFAGPAQPRLQVA